MRRLSRHAFVDQFPMMVPAAKIHGVQKGNVIARAGSRILGNGIIKGSLVVDADAVAYFSGIIQKNVVVRGAACIEGIVNGTLDADGDAAVAFDGNHASSTATVRAAKTTLASNSPRDRDARSSSPSG